MKNLLFLIFLLSTGFISCKKADTRKCLYTTPTKVATAAEISYLQNYLSANNIVAQQHTSGVFYVISSNGTGSQPSVCSNITIKYSGSLLGGGVFDSNTTVTGAKFVLGELILGIQTVLPMVRTGGAVSLYIPPSLGYGSTTIMDNYGNVLIPANSYLKFDIELLDVQ